MMFSQIRHLANTETHENHAGGKYDINIETGRRPKAADPFTEGNRAL